nr:hypothetical protein [Micromonospora sp. DSM 115978]
MQGAANLDAGVTIAQAAALLGVRPGRIRNWCNRGWRGRDGQKRAVTVVGLADRGHKRYRYGDLLDAWVDTRRSPHTPGVPWQQLTA